MSGNGDPRERGMMLRRRVLRLCVTRFGSPSRAILLVPGLLLVALFASGCGALSGPPPTPVVVVVTAPPVVVTAPPVIVVVTATPAPPSAATASSSGVAAATPAPGAGQAVATSKPAGSPTVVAQAKPTVPATPPTPAPQTLQVGRTNSYRGLLFTVEEARSDQKIERETARSGETLVGLRMKAQNPNGLVVHFANNPLGELVRLRLPDGGTVKAEAVDPLYRPKIEPQESLTGWFIFRLDRPAPLESLALALGGGQETAVTIPLSGPEPTIAKRTFEYLRTTEIVEGMYWSVSGGELRLDIPGQQANPGQEFIVVKIRATNPTTEPKVMGKRGSVALEGSQYLRIRADNGVLLQVSGELSKMPTEFPGKAEQDTLYAWQLPLGSKNPKLVILSPDGAEHELELGPLPPP
jgi:hypothetical protein